MNYSEKSLSEHKRLRGKISVTPKAHIVTKDDLATFYSPGVGAVSSAIAENPELAWEYTIRGNTVAVISDGSAVLGLGNIGPLAAQPVMAGKAVLFKEFADIDAFPLVLDTQDTDEIIRTVKILAPSFGGINLEDISAPRCFAIEAALQDLGIPVMHDDQHGTAIVVLAGLLNACKVTGRDLTQLTIVLSGAGAGGTAVAEMIIEAAPGVNIIAVDSKGILSSKRTDLNLEKISLLEKTNKKDVSGDLADALHSADVFIGLSKANVLSQTLIKTMAEKPIIFALANPVPEIMPDLAYEAGAYIVATGRSDFPNQVNNVLAFPGVFRGALDAGATRITKGMRRAAAYALASSIDEPRTDMILPSPLDKSIAPRIAEAVAKAAIDENVTRKSN